MRVRGWIGTALVVGVAALLLAACGSSPQATSGSKGPSGSSGSTTPSPSPTPTATATPTPAASTGPVKVTTATVQGKTETIFTNGAGMTLYYYTPDKDASVTCTGGCASAWPPLAAGSSTPGPMPGVSGTWGSDSDPSGGSVVTYNGWPLYTYVSDTAPGQTNGQGVGGVWFVATPSLAASSTGS
jgi:predicted lipoprotein with Yx(FWY)xxD motif